MTSEHSEHLLAFKRFCLRHLGCPLSLDFRLVSKFPFSFFLYIFLNNDYPIVFFLMLKWKISFYVFFSAGFSLDVSESFAFYSIDVGRSDIKEDLRLT